MQHRKGAVSKLQSLSVTLPAWLVDKAGWLAVYTAPKSCITKSAARGLTRGRLHRRHTAPRDATAGRPKKQPKKEPKPGHKRGNRQKGKGLSPPQGKDKASLRRKGRTTDKGGMVGHGVRKTPRSLRSYERSRKMRWALRQPMGLLWHHFEI